MMEYLLALLVALHDAGEWKERVYEEKYSQIISNAKRMEKSNQNNEKELEGNISWYAKGLKNPQALTTACWDEYPKGTKFRVTYESSSVIVVCTDRGAFKDMGRFLDLSSGAFRKLAPLSRGIIKAKVKIIK